MSSGHLRLVWDRWRNVAEKVGISSVALDHLGASHHCVNCSESRSSKESGSRAVEGPQGACAGRGTEEVGP